MAERFACIVDGYSSGCLYAGALRERGIRAVHVQSQDPIPAAFAASFAPGDYADHLRLDGDYERCAKALAAYHPLCVIPGCDSGVMPGDRLGEMIGVPNNGTALSAARRNKYDMQQCVQAAGLLGIPSFLAPDWPAAEAWLRQLNRFPVVIKPPAGAATVQVVTCKDMASAKEGFQGIVATPDVFDRKNQGAVIQPWMEGDEYIINTVSCAGDHVMTSVWKVEKLRGKYTLYDALTLQPHAGQPILAIREYIFAALDAVGLRYGAAHSEVFWTPEGAMLIEINARIGGQKGSLLVEKATGRKYVEAVLDSYLDPEQFHANYAATPYQLHKQVCRVELISPKTGTLVALPKLDEIRKLASFEELVVSRKIGGPIKQTTDFFTVPGFVDLLHPDPQVIARDRARIRELEADGFYDIAD